MDEKIRFASVNPSSIPWPVSGPTLECLARFFREEVVKHHRCLEEQREYYSDVAISQAEEALSRVMGQIEQLSRRADASEVVEELLRQLDVVTRLSAWADPGTLH